MHNEKELVNALNALWEVHDNLPYALKVNALNYFDQFEEGKDFAEFDLTFIEWLAETGMNRGEK